MFLKFFSSYRLAPEHPFPAGFDDCYKVTEYVLANTAEFGIDPKRVMIGGASAGGNLTAAVGTKLRDEGLSKKIRAQLVNVPVTQAHDFETSSYRGGRNDILLSQPAMVEMWAKYALGNNYKDALQSMIQNRHVPQEKRNEFAKLCGNSPLLSRTVKSPTDNSAWKRLQPALENPYCAPLVAKDLTGIAPSIVVIGEQDVLRDDALMYAERLQQSGVKIFVIHSEEMFHGTSGLKNIAPLDYEKMYRKMLSHIKELLE